MDILCPIECAPIHVHESHNKLLIGADNEPNILK